MYFDRHLPVNPGQAPLVFGHDIERLIDRLGPDHQDVRELRSVLSAFLSLPAMSQTDDEAIVARQRGKEAARRQLERLTCSSPAVRRHIERAVAAFNGTPAFGPSSGSGNAIISAVPIPTLSPLAMMLAVVALAFGGVWLRR